MDCRIRMRTILRAVRPEAPELPDAEDEVARTGLYIIRNAGGRAQEALRSIIVSQSLLNTTDIHVVHHLGCGMAGHSEESLRGVLLEEIAPPEAVARGITMHQLAQYQFLPIRSGVCIHDAAESVRVDMALLKNHPLIRTGTNIRGWLYLNIDRPPGEHKLMSVDAQTPNPDPLDHRAECCRPRE